MFVIEKHGLERLIQLLSKAIEPTFVLVAVYNICLEFEVPSSEASTIPATPEFPQVNAAQSTLASAQGDAGESSFDVLLTASHSLPDDLKSIAADLIEIASHAACIGVSFLAKASDAPAADDEHKKNNVSTLNKKNKQDGQKLASFSAESCVSICNAITNLMKQQEVRLAIIHQNLVSAVMFLPWAFDESGQKSDRDSGAVSEDLPTCRRLFIRVLYELTDEPSYASQYCMDGDEIISIVACFNEVLQRPLDECRPSPAYSGLLIANMINSVSRAEIFVREHGIQKPVCHILLHADDPDMLFVALGLLNKLSLSEVNRVKLLEHGTANALGRVLSLSTSSDVQREAVAACRLLIKDRPASLRSITQELTVSAQKGIQEQHLPMQLLHLFDQTTDSATKIEVARFVVEVCRNESKKEEHTDSLLQKFDSKKSVAAEAVAFLAQHGHGNATSEGWFGLGLISTRESSAPLILDIIERPVVKGKLEKIAGTERGPDYDNVSLMLAKLLSFSVRNFHSQIDDLTSLDHCWPPPRPV